MRGDADPGRVEVGDTGGHDHGGAGGVDHVVQGRQVETGDHHPGPAGRTWLLLHHVTLVLTWILIISSMRHVTISRSTVPGVR